MRRPVTPPLMSDSFVRYPPVQHPPGQAPTPVRGILAGSPQAAPGGAPPLSPRAVATPGIVIYAATFSTEPDDILTTPAGDPSLYSIITVMNQGAGFTAVSQSGLLLGVVPPFSQATFQLYPGGGPVAVTGWDGGDPAVTGTGGGLIAVWANTMPLQTEMSWAVTGGGGEIGTPFPASAASGVDGSTLIVSAKHLILTSVTLSQAGPGNSEVVDGAAHTLLFMGSDGQTAVSYPRGLFLDPTGVGGSASLAVSGAGAGTFVVATVSFAI